MSYFLGPPCLVSHVLFVSSVLSPLVLPSLTIEDSLGEVDRGALVSAVALQFHHIEDLPADGRRRPLRDKIKDCN